MKKKLSAAVKNAQLLGLKTQLFISKLNVLELFLKQTKTKNNQFSSKIGYPIKENNTYSSGTCLPWRCLCWGQGWWSSAFAGRRKRWRAAPPGCRRRLLPLTCRRTWSRLSRTEKKDYHSTDPSREQNKLTCYWLVGVNWCQFRVCRVVHVKGAVKFARSGKEDI